MSQALLDAKRELEDLLAPYGYFFVSPDRRTSLNLVFADIGLIALGVLAWGITQYLKAFISETGKLHAKMLASTKNEADHDRVEGLLNEIVSELKKLGIEQQTAAPEAAALMRVEAHIVQALEDTRMRRAISGPDTAIVLDASELAAYLADLGASHGRAEQLAAEICPSLQQRLETLTSSGVIS